MPVKPDIIALPTLPKSIPLLGRTLAYYPFQLRVRTTTFMDVAGPSLPWSVLP